MIELAELTPHRLVGALLLHDHDEIDLKQLDRRLSYNGQIDDATRSDEDGEVFGVQLDVTEVASVADEVFPACDLEGDEDLRPGENDAYRSAVVAVARDLVPGHVVVVEVDHSGAGNSDESHEGYIGGHAGVFPTDAAETAIAAALRRLRRQAAQAAASSLREITRTIARLTDEDIAQSDLPDAMAAFSREMARSI